MGAKRGRTKGNEQEAEYENLEGKHEKSGWRERGNRGSESGDGHRESKLKGRTGKRRKGKTESQVARTGTEADERKQKGKGKARKRKQKGST